LSSASLFCFDPGNLAVALELYLFTSKLSDKTEFLPSPTIRPTANLSLLGELDYQPPRLSPLNSCMLLMMFSYGTLNGVAWVSVCLVSARVF